MQGVSFAIQFCYMPCICFINNVGRDHFIPSELVQYAEDLFSFYVLRSLQFTAPILKLFQYAEYFTCGVTFNLPSYLSSSLNLEQIKIMDQIRLIIC
jgi:hypothetical protein